MSLVVACAVLLAIDGDSIRCDGVNMRDMGPGEPFKSGYDAPEIRNAKCPQERLLGELAKQRLQEMLDQRGTRVVDSGEVDRFGRPLVWVYMEDGTPAGAIMIRDGYAVSWPNQMDWCAP